MILGHLNHVVLCCIPKGVERLQCHRVVLVEALKLGVRQALPQTVIETESHALLAWLAYCGAPGAVHDDCLQQQFKTAVEKDQYSLCAPPIPRSIEMVHGEHERVHGLCVERPAFLPHGYEPRLISSTTRVPDILLAHGERECRLGTGVNVRE